MKNKLEKKRLWIYQKKIKEGLDEEALQTILLAIMLTKMIEMAEKNKMTQVNLQPSPRNKTMADLMECLIVLRNTFQWAKLTKHWG